MPRVAQTDKLSAIVPWALLALLAFLVYTPTLGAGFLWDDDALTVNPLMGSIAGLWRIWLTPGLIPREQHYWPLVYSTFWLEHLLFGLRPFIYHLNNILLHCAVTLLLWRVLLKLAVPGAWLAAALFAVHPVHAESVAWIIERKDVLSGALYLGAALAFLHFHEASGSTRQRLYGLAILLFAGALLSKSIVVSLPVALGFALWLRHGRLTRRDLLALAPLVLLALAVTLADLQYVQAHKKPGIENSGLALPERAQMAGRAIWVYLSKLVLPYPLAAFYPKWTVARTSLAAWTPLLAWLLLLAGLWIARKRLGRGAFVALAFYSVTLAPALGVIDFEFLRLSWIADRFQYLASAGPLALVAAALVLLARKMQWQDAATRYSAAALLAIPALLCLRQASFYKDSVTFFHASAGAYPQCWPAHANLAWELTQAGRGGEAVQSLNEGLRRMPQPEHHLTHAMAVALASQQRFTEAEQYFLETLRIKSDFIMGRVAYADFLANQGRSDEALSQYREALRLEPDNGSALNNMGNALRSQKKLAEAAECLNHALRLNPRDVEAHVNLALVYIDERKIPQAVEQCRQALALDPNQYVARFTLGQALLAQGQYREAATHFEQAVRLQPRSLGALFLLGQTYQAMGDARAAAHYYQESLKVQPGFPDAIQALRSLGVSMR